MIEATSMSISYDENEDRLVIVCGNVEKRCLLWLTRRITERLLTTFVELIERINPTLGKVPAEMRTEMIAFEHQSALSRTQGAVAPASTGQQDCGAALVTKVNVKATPEAFQLTFFAPEGPLVQFTGMRENFHKTLSLLSQCASSAGWNLGGSVAWLQASDEGDGRGRVAS